MKSHHSGEEIEQIGTSMAPLLSLRIEWKSASACFCAAHRVLTKTNNNATEEDCKAMRMARFFLFNLQMKWQECQPV